MVKRFLEYSLAHHRKIKAFYMDAGQVRACNILVTQINGPDVACLVAGKKVPLVIPMEDFLSACYARGDAGDTLCNNLKEDNNDK